MSPAPFRLSFAHRGGSPLVAEAETSGGPGGRLSYRLRNGTFHALTELIGTATKGAATEYRVATDEPGRTATVDVQPTAAGASVTFTLEPATGVVATFEAFAAAPGDDFLGGGERPGTLDLRGQAFAVKAAYACQNTMPAPFFASSAGYGVSLRSSTIASFAFPGSVSSSACPGGASPRCPLADGLDVVQLCIKSPRLAYNLFAGTPKKVVSRYVQTIGRPRLPPPAQLALIKWRDVVGGSADLFDDVDRLHALHVPIGWVLLDNPWETASCYGEMTFDPQRFPRPEAMIAALHRRGVRFMLWISPLVRQQFCPPPSQYPQSVLYGTGGKAVTIDLTDPAARSTFESSLRTLIQLGVDGFKADRGDEIDLESYRLAGGAGVDLHNEYPRVYARSVAAAVRAAGRASSFATLFRAGAPGSAALAPGFWGGDQEGTFSGLQQAIHEGLSAGAAGYAIWGSDTGGYGATESAEVLVRWAQFSALTPVFEVGGTGGNGTFWEYGTKTVSLFRAAAVLHYELFPYLYDLARVAHASGLPVLRPLALEYPADANAWRQDLEVLVGRDLLAAPVTSAAPAGASGTVLAPVYLPAGSWVDLETGVAERGGRAPFARDTPLAEQPLYLRAGAAVPFAARSPLVWPRPWPTNALELPGRGGWLYAPAAGTRFARSPEFGSFHVVGRGRSFALTLRSAPRESQVLLATEEIPRSVRIEGRRVPQAASLASLRRAREGWTLAAAPFPGIVLKLAPRAGVARAVVSLP
ncbi:MAG: alpha-D-xyloside xylohydrolase [Actinomycetota bacterium]|jgi:alpha-D-xyloside xylohydrolase